MELLTLQIILLLILLLLSGLFSGSEIALVSLKESRIKQMLQANVYRSKTIQKLRLKPQRMLATILLGNNLVNVAAAAITTSITLSLFNSYAISIATGMMTLLILIFGEIMPKSVAFSYNEKFSLMAAPIIYSLSLLFSPLITGVLFLSNIIPNLLGIQYKNKVITQEDILSAINLAHEKGTLKKTEKDLLTKVFDFKDKRVVEIMTPLRKVITIQEETPLYKALPALKKHKRIPIYKKNKSDITGVINVKEVIHEIEKNKELPVITKMKEPVFTPENTPISQVFKQMQTKRQHLFPVVNEHGEITGIITLEDIMEEIVGEINEESTNKQKPIIKTSKNTYLVQGETPIERINKKLKLKIIKKHFNTIAGYLLSEMGSIPKSGDVYKTKTHIYTIKKVEQRTIKEIQIEKIVQHNSSKLAPRNS